MEQFESEIRSRFRPVIAVCSDAGVENACARSGLTFVDLLRQYASNIFTEHRQAPPLRVTENLTIRPDRTFAVRFHDVTSLHATPTATAEKHLALLMQQLMDNQKFPTDVLERLLARKGQPDPGSDLTPWFTVYSSEFMRTLQFGSHEMMDSPLAIVYAIDASNEDCNMVAEGLLSRSTQRAFEPPGMSHEVLYPFHDTTFPRHFVLVYNCEDTSLSRATVEAKFEALQSGRLRKKGGFTLLTVNRGSGADDEAGAQLDWLANRCAPLPGTTSNGVVATGGEPLGWPDPAAVGGRLGCRLSKQDLREVGIVVQDVLISTLLPNMEARLGRLRLATEEHRSRMNKVVKSFASLVGIVSNPNRSAQTGQTAADGGLFKYTSPEGMMRQVGDMAFMLGAYDVAEEYYRHIADEFSKAKAAKNYGAACEAVALARFMQPDKSDDVVWRYFIDAFDAYAGMDTKMCKAYAVRSALLHAKAYTALQRYAGAWTCYTQAAHLGEGALKAMMLEQAAHCKALEPLPKHRKFAKYMVLAGLNYCNMGYLSLGIAALKQGVRTLEGKPWHLIRNELAHRLGSFCRKQAMWRDAALCLKETLAHCGESDPAFQARSLEAYMALLDTALDARCNLYSDPDVLQLPVPQMDERYCHVHTSGHRVLGNTGAQNVAAAEWAVIEDRLMSSAQVASSSAMDTRKFADGSVYSVTFAGEAVNLQVRFRNPLGIPLRLENVCLVCVFSPPDQRLSVLPSDLTSLLAARATQDKVSIQSVTVQLQAGELITLRLSVRPQVAGWLQIGAVLWDTYFANEVPLRAPGCCLIRPRAAKAKSKDHAVSELIARATRGMGIARASEEAWRVAPALRHPLPSQRLTMQVIPSAPLVTLQPAIPSQDGPLDPPALPRALVSELFKSDVTLLPDEVFVGELVPLHLVVSNFSGRSVRNLRLGTSSTHVTLLPDLSRAEQVAAMQGQELLERFSQLAPAPSQVVESSATPDGAPTAAVFPLSPTDAGWHRASTDAGSGAFLPVTLWFHPQAAGPATIHLVLYFEDVTGKCRMVRFSHALTVTPLLSNPAIKAGPAANSLTLFAMELGLASKLAGPSAVDIKEILCTSRHWRICADDSSPNASAAANELVTTSMRTDARLPTTGSYLIPHLRVVLAPAAAEDEASQRRSSGDDAAAGDGPQPLEHAVSIVVRWQLEPSARPASPSRARPPTVDSLVRSGLVHERDITLLDDGATSAFRMVATHPRPEELRPVWSAMPGLPPQITPMPVTVRVRNCSVHPMSVCIEGGVSAVAMVPAPQVSAGCWMSMAGGGGGRLPLTPPMATLGASRRHQWAGRTRVHVPELLPRQEFKCEMLVVLHGDGAFVVEDYVCTWNIPKLNVVGSSMPGSPLHVTIRRRAEP